MRRRAGFTLIEVMIWLTVSAVVFIAFLSFEYFARHTTFETSAHVEALQHTERIIRRLEEDSFAANGSRTVTSDGVMFEIPSLDQAGSPLEGVHDTVYYFIRYEDDGRLVRKVTPGPGSASTGSSTVIARHVENIEFELASRGGSLYPVLQVGLRFSIPVVSRKNLERNYRFAVPLENCPAGGEGE